MTNSEYTVERSARARDDVNPARSSNRTRRIYFVLAALWGFGTGAIGLAAGAKLAGSPFGVSPAVLVVLAVGVPVALLGGYIAEEAYREARRRLR